MALRRNLILRRPQSGRLEGRTTFIQLETETPSLGGSGATPARSASSRLSVNGWCEAGLDLCALVLPPLLALVPHGAAPLAGVAGLCAAGLIAVHPPYHFPALRGPAGVVVALVLWGALSAAGAIGPEHHPALAARLAGVFAPALPL